MVIQNNAITLDKYQDLNLGSWDEQWGTKKFKKNAWSAWNKNTHRKISDNISLKLACKES